MALFQVLRGVHHEGGKTYYGRHKGKGDVVDSKSDLSKHNPPPESGIPPRFKRVEGSAVVQEPPDDGLGVMTVAGLEDLAAEEEIDLGQATRRADVIAAIRAARGSDHFNEA